MGLPSCGKLPALEDLFDQQDKVRPSLKWLGATLYDTAQHTAHDTGLPDSPPVFPEGCPPAVNWQPAVPTLLLP